MAIIDAIDSIATKQAQLGYSPDCVVLGRKQWNELHRGFGMTNQSMLTNIYTHAGCLKVSRSTEVDRLIVYDSKGIFQALYNIGLRWNDSI